MSDSNPPEGEITIDLGKSSSSPPEPFGSVSLKLRSWVNIVATLMALGAGTAAFAKPTDTSVTQASYEELKKAIEANARDNKQNHEDILALRNFLDGYLKGTPPPVGTMTSSSSAPSTPATGVPTVPKAIPHLPSIHSAPAPLNLPTFDKVKK